MLKENLLSKLESLDEYDKELAMLVIEMVDHDKEIQIIQDKLIDKINQRITEDE
jgi:hypothetical protein